MPALYDKNNPKVHMKAMFEDMDYFIKRANAMAQQIKAAAPDYWKARGIGPVLPRLEALRKDVFSD
jgi:hypothetical protein